MRRKAGGALANRSCQHSSELAHDRGYEQGKDAGETPALLKQNAAAQKMGMNVPCREFPLHDHGDGMMAEASLEAGLLPAESTASTV
jgi:hypothetical protein